MKNLLLLVSFSTILVFSPASAQDRYYVWAYPYGTTAANEFELESNSFFFTPSLSNNEHSLIQQFELEYGVTDRFQLGLYQVFSRDYPSGNVSAESFILEALYELARKNEFAVNPMLYLEYERDWNFRNPNRAEAKLILSKDFGRLNGTLNGIAEYEFGGSSQLTREFSAGVSYEVMKGFRAGVETFMTLGDEDDTADDDLGGTGIGPTVSLATPWFDITSGVTFGLSKNSNAVNFCTMIGFDL